ncbi:PRD domain-containing protein [Faecalicoccus pleomorphus]|uniref:PRD domain-containing protein n=1 Tax=Faecalicoccus pleomorphus TaxID=1323 RepID=UPI00242D1FE6|nr:PRD domain-containing protein [Faecalicoccus pleomorphus]
MKLIKKLNNNFVLGRDSAGKIVVIEGKGIGFLKLPIENYPLDKITKTYYGMDDYQINLIERIDTSILNISKEIYLYANKILGNELNPSLLFVLADHIQFAIERIENNVEIHFSLKYDLCLLYPKEIEIANYAIRCIKTKLKSDFPDEEVVGIALNIINAEKSYSREMYFDSIIEKIIVIIEKTFEVSVDRKSFSYSRFYSHMNYLLRKKELNTKLYCDVDKMYRELISDYSEIEKCVESISDFLIEENIFSRVSIEEKLYIFLHVSRIIAK